MSTNYFFFLINDANFQSPSPNTTQVKWRVIHKTMVVSEIQISVTLGTGHAEQSRKEPIVEEEKYDYMRINNFNTAALHAAVSLSLLDRVFRHSDG